MAEQEPNKGSRKAWLSAMHRINATQFSSREERSEAFREHGKARPGRVSQAARTLPKSKSFSKSASGSAERDAEVKKWQSERPGGGRPSGATHAQWTAWGSRNPNRGSNAGRTMSNVSRADKS